MDLKIKKAIFIAEDGSLFTIDTDEYGCKGCFLWDEAGGDYTCNMRVSKDGPQLCLILGGNGALKRVKI